MMINVKHVQRRGPKEWRYRRKVPMELRAIMGKREILLPLGATEAEAIRRYAKVHAAAEAELIAARTTGTGLQATEWGLYRGGVVAARKLGFRNDRSFPDERTMNGDADWQVRWAAINKLARKYDPNFDKSDSDRDDDYDDEFDANDLKVSEEDTALARAILLDVGGVPHPTVEDAKRLYSKEKVGDDDAKLKQLEWVFKMVQSALGRDRRLTTIRRDDAKEVRDYMLDGRSRSSVDRYLNVVRAVFNHAIKEFDLNWRNPFMGLEVSPKDKAEPDRDKRRPFNDAELTLTNARIANFARTDLRQIWQILEQTGCRLAEVAGLRVQDVRLDHAIPHLTVEWHDDRRIKNKVSRRDVPLIGDALTAAREAVTASSGALLFPAYARKGGPASASAALGKHVRACVSDTKVTTHSLRHLMKDRLRLAGVSKTDQDIVLGHASGSVGEDYGGSEARLKVTSRALVRALGTQ